MPSYNRVVLVGNLTRDPELRYTPNGTPVANLTIAVNERYTSQGEKKERTSYFDAEVWGRQAEVCGEYLSKGKCILIEGKLRQSKWTDNEGKARTKIRISVDNFQFLSPRGSAEAGDGAGAPRPRPFQDRKQPQDAPAGTQENNNNEEFGEEPYYDDDIPF